MNKNHMITGIILAGGEGQRMGRKNKGLIQFSHRPLVSYVIDQLRPQLNHLIISANEDIQTYQTFGFPVVSDKSDFKQQGPLSGILSANSLVSKDTDTILVVPCDTPFLPNNLVSRLQKALYSQPDYEIAFAATETQIHPSIFLCKKYINAALAEHLAQQKFSLKSWIFRHNSIKTVFEDEHAFTNMNDMKTLQENE